MAESHREAFGGQRRRGGAAGRECHGEEDGGTVADSHREAFAGQGAAAEHHREAVTTGKESHCQKGKVRSATAGKKGLQRSNGLVSFFDAPLMQIIPIFVVW